MYQVSKGEMGFREVMGFYCSHGYTYRVRCIGPEDQGYWEIRSEKVNREGVDVGTGLVISIDDVNVLESKVIG